MIFSKHVNLHQPKANSEVGNVRSSGRITERLYGECGDYRGETWYPLVWSSFAMRAINEKKQGHRG
jgi:hypothetical protein